MLSICSVGSGWVRIRLGAFYSPACLLETAKARISSNSRPASLDRVDNLYGFMGMRFDGVFVSQDGAGNNTQANSAYQTAYRGTSAAYLVLAQVLGLFTHVLEMLRVLVRPLVVWHRLRFFIKGRSVELLAATVAIATVRVLATIGAQMRLIRITVRA